MASSSTSVEAVTESSSVVDSETPSPTISDTLSPTSPPEALGDATSETKSVESSLLSPETLSDAEPDPIGPVGPLPHPSLDRPVQSGHPLTKQIRNKVVIFFYKHRKQFDRALFSVACILIVAMFLGDLRRFVFIPRTTLGGSSVKISPEVVPRPPLRACDDVDSIWAYHAWVAETNRRIPTLSLPNNSMFFWNDSLVLSKTNDPVVSGVLPPGLYLWTVSTLDQAIFTTTFFLDDSGHTHDLAVPFFRKEDTRSHLLSVRAATFLERSRALLEMTLHFGRAPTSLVHLTLTADIAHVDRSVLSALSPESLRRHWKLYCATTRLIWSHA